MPLDVEYASLVNDVFKTNIPSYLWKAFVVLPSTDEEMKHNIKVSSNHLTNMNTRSDKYSTKHFNSYIYE